MSNIKEVWAPAVYVTETGEILDFSENYEVSNTQKIKYLNFEHHKSLLKIKDLSNCKTKRRYLKVTLFLNGKQYTCAFHRLVLSSFSPHSNVYECINHKDCNTKNNSLDNLEWCSFSYNNTYKERHIKASLKTKGVFNNPKNSKPVLQYNLDGILVKEWSSIAEVHRVLGYSTPNIVCCCQHKPRYHTSHGFIWEYKN